MAAPTSEVVANVLAFIALFVTFLVLLTHSFRYKGPSGDEKYYYGFREQNLLGTAINLLCALSYFAKLLESTTGYGFAPFTAYRYLDYCMTCPLIALDLLWNINAPYKATMTFLVLMCLITAVASSATPAPASYAWFGMGMLLFAGTYAMILNIVRERLDLYVVIAKDIQTKQSIKYLRTGCYIFFGIWLVYPILWVLGKDATGVVSLSLDHMLTSMLDVFAKSAYGFALLYFRTYFDRKLDSQGIDLDELANLTHVQLREVVGLVSKANVRVGTAIKYVTSADKRDDGDNRDGHGPNSEALERFSSKSTGLTALAHKFPQGLAKSHRVSASAEKVDELDRWPAEDIEQGGYFGIELTKRTSHIVTKRDEPNQNLYSHRIYSDDSSLKPFAALSDENAKDLQAQIASLQRQMLEIAMLSQHQDNGRVAGEWPVMKGRDFAAAPATLNDQTPFKKRPISISQMPSNGQEDVPPPDRPPPARSRPISISHAPPNGQKEVLSPARALLPTPP